MQQKFLMVSGAQCTGAAGQWGPMCGAWRCGARCRGACGHWGRVHWGRRLWGTTSLGQDVVGHDVTGVISVGHSALGQEVSGARRCGARRCGAQRHWGKISGAEGHGARRSGAGRRQPSDHISSHHTSGYVKCLALYQPHNVYMLPLCEAAVTYIHHTTIFCMSYQVWALLRG